MHLISVQVGQPRTVGVPGSDDPMERVLTSAIWKEPVVGPIWAGALGLAGDAVADRRHHGGRDQALLAYAHASYAAWRAEWNRPDLGAGGFGENLTIDGATEETVCIGDVIDVGEARFQVSQPREPCGNLARRHQMRDLVRTVYGNGRTGWYLRVLREGWISGGSAIPLVERPHPEWTVRRASLVMLQQKQRREEALLLSRCPALSEKWRRALASLSPTPA